MRPLFTIHAGEYLVGAYIEKHFKRVNVWIPARDTGIDLLVSDKENRRCVSLQVKFSKDFLVTHLAAVFQKGLRASGWWTIDADKLQKSPADYWVFVLQGFERRTTDFVVVQPRSLLRRYHSIHPVRAKKIHSYLWVTEGEQCWETRGLNHSDQLLIAEGGCHNRRRDFTSWLNKWTPVSRLNRVSGSTRASDVQLHD
jgi:hypothetical protein